MPCTPVDMSNTIPGFKKASAVQSWSEPQVLANATEECKGKERTIACLPKLWIFLHFILRKEQNGSVQFSGRGRKHFSFLRKKIAQLCLVAYFAT